MNVSWLLILIVYLVFSLYSLRQLIYWVRRAAGKQKKIATLVVLVVFLVLTLLPVPGFADRVLGTMPGFAAGGLGRFARWISNRWCGFFICMTIALFLLNILRFIMNAAVRNGGNHSGGKDEPIFNAESRRRKAQAAKKKRWDAKPAVACIALAFALIVPLAVNVYGMKNAEDVVTTNYKVNIPKTVKNVDSMRIVLVSDMHLGVNADKDTFENMAEQIEVAKPDLVLIAGDQFSGPFSDLKDPDAYLEIMKQITAPEGVYVVDGNHDTPEEAESRKFYEDAGFQLLEDESVKILDGKVQLIGRRDKILSEAAGAEARKTPQALMNEMYINRPTIVLQHEPAEFGLLAANGADLTVCGHTHGGQIWPMTLFTQHSWKYNYGQLDVDGMDVIVTCGVGTAGPPLRIGADPEIAVIDVTFGEEAQEDAAKTDETKTDAAEDEQKEDTKSEESEDDTKKDDETQAEDSQKTDENDTSSDEKKEEEEEPAAPAPTGEYSDNTTNKAYTNGKTTQQMWVTIPAGSETQAEQTLVAYGLFDSIDDYKKVCAAVGVEPSAIKATTFVFEAGLTKGEIAKRVTA